MTFEDHELERPALPARPAIDGSDIRKLTTEDLPRIARALARAFDDDPVMNFVFPRDSERLARLERGFSLYLRKIWLRHDECYANDTLSGAALWLPPDRWHLSVLAQLRLLPSMIAEVGRNLPRLMTVLRLMEKRHPKEPAQYYLAVLGVEPELQGRGFGGALMQPVLARCDRERVPAYLESSKHRNIAFYERHGFNVVDELKVPNGPTLWPMWREPAA
jgi:ribosomal protein S18 acetylase RimI-like enzyme